MNILLINHYAGCPEYGMEYRPYYLAREWVKMGHNITIVGANFSHLRIKQPMVGEELIDGIRYVWLDTPAYQGNGLRRVKNMLVFLWKLYWHEQRVNSENKPDVVIASSTYPLDIYPAHHIARKYNAKLIFEVHDIWPLTPMEIGKMSKYHPFIMVMQMAENYMCRHVDKLISILPMAEEHYLEHGLSKGKFIYIPNGIDTDEICSKGNELSDEYLELFTALRKRNRFIIGYVGGMAISNSLASLIEAIKEVHDLPVDIVMVGDGAEKANLQRMVRQYSLENVHFLPPVSKNLVYAVLTQMDALYIGWIDSELYKYGVSANKIFDYLMAEKPIIWVGSTGNNHVREADAGVVSISGKYTDIETAIRQMVYAGEKKLRVWGKNGREYVMAKHDYKKLAVYFISQLNS